MDEKQVSKVSEGLQAVLGEVKLDELARATGYCEKKRLLTPFRMVLALIAALGGRRVQFLSDLQRQFNALFGTDVAYKPFHNRLAKASFPDFMRAVAQEAWQQWSEKVLTPEAKGLFSEFEQVVLHDGSSFAVKDSLRQELPGRFYTTSAAAVELHVSLDLLTGAPLRVTVSPDTESERAHQPGAEALTGCLFMADRGYFDKKRLRDIDQHQGAFIVRAPVAINPCIVDAQDADGKPLPNLIGRKLKTVRYQLWGAPPVDLTVEWKDGSQAPIRMRLIMTYNPRHFEFQYLATNLDRSRYDAHAIREAYRLRWQVELLFKEWKSYANLHAFNTGKRAIAEGLIWASLTAAALNRYMAHATQRITKVEISTQRAALSAVHFIGEIVRACIAATHSILDKAVETAIRYLATNARRAHPKRDRATGRTSSGFSSIGVNA